MNELEAVRCEVRDNIRRLGADDDIRAALSQTWLRHSVHHKYSYNFSWLGRPIIQYPQDLMAMQEIIGASSRG